MGSIDRLVSHSVSHWLHRATHELDSDLVIQPTISQQVTERSIISQ